MLNGILELVGGSGGEIGVVFAVEILGSLRYRRDGRWFGLWCCPRTFRVCNDCTTLKTGGAHIALPGSSDRGSDDEYVKTLERICQIDLYNIVDDSSCIAAFHLASTSLLSYCWDQDPEPSLLHRFCTWWTVVRSPGALHFPDSLFLVQLIYRDQILDKDVNDTMGLYGGDKMRSSVDGRDKT